MRLRKVGESGLQSLSKQGLLGGDKMAKLDFYESCVYWRRCRMSFNDAIGDTAGIVDYIPSYLGASRVAS